ncbi:MAG: FGGY family carbohydrate kinase [Anaerolineae bacterium]|nr:FGGY family carbohydrate kinase [Anaerolineae bacterium]
MRLLGLDIGTTGCKAALFEQDGTLVASASREYDILINKPGWAEQDAEAVWRRAQDALREVLAATRGGAPVKAIGLSVQGEAIIPVDATGCSLRPAILGMDTRTGTQNDWLREHIGARHLFDRTGMPVHTINTLPKLLWLREHETALWEVADRFLLYEDFIIGKMTGEPVISRCLASRTQLYDLRDDAWSGEILEALALDASRLAPVRPSGFCVGPMGTGLAADLGFDGAPLVVTGGHDQACGALGVGLTQPGLAMVSTGTAEVVEVALSSPALNATLYAGNISVYAHTVAELYLAMTLNHSGGMLLRWYRDTFGREEIEAAASYAHHVGDTGRGREAYDFLLAEASSEPTSLLLLPHFAGSGTPTFDTGSKGAILGLTFGTTKAEIAKAILEGLTFELRTNLDLLRAGGVEIDELRAIGGGARSDLWLQLKADVTGIPVVAPRVTDAACWGAALLAGCGAGCFDSLVQAAAEGVHLERRFEPDGELVGRYAERYALYTDLYPTLSDLLHRI